MSTALGNQRIPMSGLPRSAQSLLKMLEGMHCGQLTLKTPEGEILQFQGAESGIQAEWVVNDWRILSLLARDGDIAFGRGYMEGLWESSDPVALLRLAIANRAMVEKYIEGSWSRRLIFTLLNRLLRANTRRGSRKNISFHYDLGNEFYQLWLDSSMTYSSALYDGDDSLTLTDAQERKYARALSALNLAPGSRLLEIGCGWGGFAEYAARGLQLLERKDFGQDYARTLRIWRHRFDIQEEAVKSLGYDSVFCKMWRFYLVYCEAGFAEGEIDLTQVTLTHG